VAGVAVMERAAMAAAMECAAVDTDGWFYVCFYNVAS
jgi:hypothetical protein